MASLVLRNGTLLTSFRTAYGHRGATRPSLYSTSDRQSAAQGNDNIPLGREEHVALRGDTPRLHPNTRGQKASRQVLLILTRMTFSHTNVAAVECLRPRRPSSQNGTRRPLCSRSSAIPSDASSRGPTSW